CRACKAAVQGLDEVRNVGQLGLSMDRPAAYLWALSNTGVGRPASGVGFRRTSSLSWQTAIALAGHPSIRSGVPPVLWPRCEPDPCASAPTRAGSAHQP